MRRPGEFREAPLVLADGTVVFVSEGTLYEGNGEILFFEVQ